MRTDISVLLLNGDGLAADGTPNDGGCGFYRIREPGRVTADLGVQVDVGHSLPVEAEVRTINGEDHYNIFDLHVKPDVIVFQRPLLQAFYETIKFAQKRGIACVVELDDDLMAVHKQNVAHDEVHPDLNKTSNWKWLLACCDIADLVIAATPELARRYAGHGRGVVLRNCVPEAFLKTNVFTNKRLRLGWTGTVQTHPEDLDEVGPHLSSIIQQYTEDNAFYVVGDGTYIREKLYLPNETGVVSTGWVPRAKYIKMMNMHFDVGVVPLKIDQFNQSKSWLKQLEMASQGIPAVVSPTDENKVLATFTENRVALKNKHWHQELKHLLTDRDYYLQRSAEVRESVKMFTYENQAEAWIRAWNLAIDNRFADKG